MKNAKEKKEKLAILHLEDSPMDAALIYEYLRENSEYDIQRDVVSGENEFISAITHKEYDLILADFSLPGFNGFTALEHSKSLCPNTPYISVSGTVGEESAVELLKQGAADYVIKDKLGRLVFSINRALKTNRETEEYKRVQNDLRVSEDKFKYVFDNSVIGKSLTLPSGEINANRAFCEMLGYSSEELREKKWQDITHPDDIEISQEETNKVLSGEKEIADFDKRYIKKDGAVVWASIRTSIRRDEEGKPLYFITSAIDITDRKRMEEELRQSEERYKQLFEYSGLGIGFYTADGVVISFNQRALENIGGRLEDYTGKSVRALFPKEEAEKYFTRIENAISGDKPQEYEDYIILNSRPKWFSSTFTRVKNANGETVGVQIASLDITDRKHAEETSKVNTIKFQYLFDEMSAGAAIYKVLNDGEYGKDYIIQDFNKSALKAERREKSEVLGRSLYDLRPNIDQYGLISVFQRVWQTGEPADFPTKIYVDEKFANWYENRVYKLPSGEIVAIFEDVTLKKQLENMLEENRVLMESIISSTTDAIYAKNLDGQYLLFNNASEKITGKSAADVLGKDDLYLFPENEALIVMAGDKKVIENREVTTYEETVSDALGKTRTFQSTKGPIYNEDKKAIGLYGVARDITERKKAEEILIYLNNHDHLTGLFNRRYFEEKLQRLDIQSQLPLSIMMGDINGVKLVNDSFGHAQGDRLIIDSAKILSSCCREGDILARIGGDEFAMIMPKTDNAAALAVLDKIQTALSTFDSCNHKDKFMRSVSLGFATKAAIDEDIGQISRIAEQYMYERKLLEHNSSHSAIISSIKATMGEKSHETAEHADRLVVISKAIAVGLHLPQTDQDRLELLATLHDIGKVGISEHILTKPGKLTEDEWVEMKRHPEIGYRIAISTPDLIPIAESILCHHERWDGHGYPRGLSGENIPLLSRILAVADAYDAMTQDRSYRKAMTHEEAIAEIYRCAGTQFDPVIAQIMIENMQ